jgi:RNA polymerase sigma-70 factor (ECF subfamily)
MLSVARAPTPTELDDATLRSAIGGDDAGARRLVEVYQARVFALVSRMLSGRGRATIEDIAQDTFLVVFRRLAQFDPRGSAKLSTWILTIAARRAIDELRKQRPVLLAEVADRGAVDDRARRREIALAIETALGDLSPELRAAFLLREYHGLEYTEIAHALQIDLGTVKSRLSRARTRLRELLSEVKP